MCYLLSCPSFLTLTLDHLLRFMDCVPGDVASSVVIVATAAAGALSEEARRPLLPPSMTVAVGSGVT